MVKITRLPSGSYRARVNIGGGKYRSFTGKNKKEVQLRAARFESELTSSEKKPADSDITVAEAVSEYTELKKNVLSPKTYREYKKLQNVLFPSLYNISVNELTSRSLQQAVNECAAVNSPKTVRNKYGLILSSVKLFRPDFSPTVTLPKAARRRVVIPTEEDMIALLEHTSGTELELPLLLAAVCGLRASEITALRWDAIDTKARTMRIEAARVLDINNDYILKGTKSAAGQRTVRLLPQVCRAMENARARAPFAEYVTTLNSRQLYRRYKRALAECCPGKIYTFHELRHYAASVMIMLGIPVKYIADYLGHETEAMVNRVYGHIMRDKSDTMFGRVEDYYTGIFEKCTISCVPVTEMCQDSRKNDKIGLKLPKKPFEIRQGKTIL